MLLQASVFSGWCKNHLLVQKVAPLVWLLQRRFTIVISHFIIIMIVIIIIMGLIAIWWQG